MKSLRTHSLPLTIFLAGMLFYASFFPAYGVDADISIDGSLRDWRRIPGESVEDGAIAGEVKAVNDAQYLYISYEGSWTNWMSYALDVYIDGQQPGSPYGTIRINDSAEADSGAVTPLNSWSAPISDSEGAFVSTDPGEFWGYERLALEFSVSLESLGYTESAVPEIELIWVTFGDTSVIASPIGEAPAEEPPAQEPLPEAPAEEPEAVEETTGGAVEIPAEETTGSAVGTPAEETTDGAVDIPLEETTEGAIEEPEDSPFDFGGTVLTVSSGLEIDGYYSDWDNVLHSDIGWGGAFVHSGALVFQDDNLYVHLAADDNWNNTQLPTSAMHLYINGNIQYDAQGNPTKATSMMLQIAEVNGDMTMGDPLRSTLKGPLLLDDLGAFEYDGWPKRYLGEAAFTIFDRKHIEGDQCEYYISLSQIADYFGVQDNEIYEITMYFPRLGAQLLTITGVSSGPYLGVALGVLIAGGYLLLRKRKEGSHR
ncbi:MAG TPA: Firmicu-CTERM sorting domain-containing protein [Clostridiales bacterium]|nr:Firmicu-CTERM sorting domain-containing protein [Clostridiales bacterium]